MSAPLVVNTADGMCFTRRGARRDGEALYALADVCTCPEIVMATLAELAEHGIVGTADVLPVPVGPVAEADGIARRIVPTQVLREDDPNGLHHTYRLGRDLPGAGERP